MKYEDIQTKSQDELLKTLLDLKKTQMELRFQHSGGQLDKTHELRAMRRSIARVQTAMNKTAAGAEVKAPKTKKETTKKAATKKTTAKKTTEEKAA